MLSLKAFKEKGLLHYFATDPFIIEETDCHAILRNGSQ